MHHGCAAWRRVHLAVVIVLLLAPAALRAQGVTTGSISGTVYGSTGASTVGATVQAVHEPSGTQYGAIVREGGAYDIRGLRVGGPYTVTAQMLGFATSRETEIFVNLNQTVDTDFTLVPEAVEVAGRDCVLLEVRRRDGARRVYELAVDVDTGLVLRSQERALDGRLLSSSEFVTIMPPSP